MSICLPALIKKIYINKLFQGNHHLQINKGFSLPSPSWGNTRVFLQLSSSEGEKAQDIFRIIKQCHEATGQEGKQLCLTHKGTSSNPYTSPWFREYRSYMRSPLRCFLPLLSPQRYFYPTKKIRNAALFQNIQQYEKGSFKLTLQSVTLAGFSGMTTMFLKWDFSHKNRTQGKEKYKGEVQQHFSLSQTRSRKEIIII